MAGRRESFCTGLMTRGAAFRFASATGRALRGPDDCETNGREKRGTTPGARRPWGRHSASLQPTGPGPSDPDDERTEVRTKVRTRIGLLEQRRWI
jgi:hypothetical protein